jgi:hypothetical protein
LPGCGKSENTIPECNVVNPFNPETDAGPAEISDSRESVLNLKPSKEFIQGIKSGLFILFRTCMANVFL